MDGKIKKAGIMLLFLILFISSKVQASDHEALIMYREPDAGTNQYYGSLEVRIRLEKGDGILKYLLSNVEGTTTGEVTGCGNEIVLGENKFKLGNNELEFWIEKEGMRVDNTTKKQSFYLSAEEIVNEIASVEEIEKIEEIKEIEEIREIEVEETKIKDEPTFHSIEDQRAPKIRTPSKYRKSSLQSFIIPEDEKLTEDETQTLEILKIDGKVYQRGVKIQEKGSHILEIWARDLAGNEARKSFLIKIGK